jgi:hypothetical protein
VKVTKQVLVPIFIGKYVNDVLYDVVPMYASHILLGRLWQFSRKETHDGVKNQYIIVKDDKIITLIPLTYKQVYDNQINMMTWVEKSKWEIRWKKTIRFDHNTKHFSHN